MSETWEWWEPAVALAELGWEVHVREPTWLDERMVIAVPTRGAPGQRAGIIIEGTRRDYWTLRTREGWRRRQREASDE